MGVGVGDRLLDLLGVLLLELDERLLQLAHLVVLLAPLELGLLGRLVQVALDLVVLLHELLEVLEVVAVRLDLELGEHVRRLGLEQRLVLVVLLDAFALHARLQLLASRRDVADLLVDFVRLTLVGGELGGLVEVALTLIDMLEVVARVHDAPVGLALPQSPLRLLLAVLEREAPPRHVVALDVVARLGYLVLQLVLGAEVALDLLLLALVHLGAEVDHVVLGLDRLHVERQRDLGDLLLDLGLVLLLAPDHLLVVRVQRLELALLQLQLETLHLVLTRQVVAHEQHLAALVLALHEHLHIVLRSLFGFLEEKTTT